MMFYVCVKKHYSNTYTCRGFPTINEADDYFIKQCKWTDIASHHLIPVPDYIPPWLRSWVVEKDLHKTMIVKFEK